MHDPRQPVRTVRYQAVHATTQGEQPFHRFRVVDGPDVKRQPCSPAALDKPLGHNSHSGVPHRNLQAIDPDHPGKAPGLAQRTQQPKQR